MHKMKIQTYKMLKFNIVSSVVENVFYSVRLRVKA